MAVSYFDLLDLCSLILSKPLLKTYVLRLILCTFKNTLKMLIALLLNSWIISWSKSGSRVLARVLRLVSNSKRLRSVLTHRPQCFKCTAFSSKKKIHAAFSLEQAVPLFNIFPITLKNILPSIHDWKCPPYACVIFVDIPSIAYV